MKKKKVFHLGWMWAALCLVGVEARGNPAGIPISGYVEDANLSPVVEPNVDFYIYVVSPDGCILYSEQHLAQNLSTAPGNFSLVIGEGTSAVNAYAPSSPQSFDHLLLVFSDDSPLITGLSGSAAGECPTGQYQPSAQDSRKLRLEFDVHDGLGMHVLTQYSVLKSVPYAHLAYSAFKVGGKSASDFVQIKPAISNYQNRVDALVADGATTVLNQVIGGTYVAPKASALQNTPAGCSAGQYAVGISATGDLSCAAVPVSTGFSGALSGDVSGPQTATVVEKIQGRAVSSTTPNANDVLTWDGVSWAPAAPAAGGGTPANFSGSLAGDVTGTQTATVVGKIQGRAVDTVAPNTNDILKWDGSKWTPAAMSGGGSVTSLTAGSGLLGGTITSTGTLSVDSTTTGVANKILSLNGSGVGGMYGLDLLASVSGAVTFQAAGTTTSYALTWPSSQGSSGQTLINNGSGALTWGTPSGGVAAGFSGSLSGDVTGTQSATVVTAIRGFPVASTTPNTSEVLTWNGSTWAPAAASGGITALTGDVTASGSGSVAATVAKVHGVSYPTSPATDTVPVVTSAGVVTYETVPVAAGGTGLISYSTGDLLYASSASALAKLGIGANGTVLTSNGTTMTWQSPGASNSFVNGGNSFAGVASLGTNDSNSLGFKTANATRMTIDTSGNLVLGTQTTRTTASGRGQLTESSTYQQTANANFTLDWNNGNTQQVASFACTGSKTITMSNISDGSSYSLYLSGNASHTGNCLFSAAGYTFKTQGGPSIPTSGKDVLFTFSVVGTTVIYSMVDNLQ